MEDDGPGIAQADLPFRETEVLAPPAMQTCHHLHGGMGMDITYSMHRYYSSTKDLTRMLGGPAHRLDLVGAQCL